MPTVERTAPVGHQTGASDIGGGITGQELDALRHLRRLAPPPQRGCLLDLFVECRAGLADHTLAVEEEGVDRAGTEITNADRSLFPIEVWITHLRQLIRTPLGP